MCIWLFAKEFLFELCPTSTHPVVSLFTQKYVTTQQLDTIEIIQSIFNVKYSKLNVKAAAETHHQDLGGDLQSPSAQLLQTLWVAADVFQKLFDGVSVLLTAHIDVHRQVLHDMRETFFLSLFI